LVAELVVVQKDCSGQPVPEATPKYYARALLGAIYNHPFEYDDDCTDYKPNLRLAQNWS